MSPDEDAYWRDEISIITFLKTREWAQAHGRSQVGQSPETFERL